jgi:acyl transferase domain-containing protein
MKMYARESLLHIENWCTNCLWYPLQVGYEAWVDSGIDFKALAGSDRVGVYAATPFGADAFSLMTANASEITGYEIAGVEPSLFASRYGNVF